MLLRARFRVRHQARQPPPIGHMQRSQSLPTPRSYISDSEMGLDEFSYRDNRHQQLRSSAIPNDVSFVGPLMGSNAVAHVGHVPELVDLILSFANRPLLFKCLFVCEMYSYIARKYLWRLLPSAVPLFNLLGPMITIGQPERNFDCWVSPYYALYRITYFDVRH